MTVGCERSRQPPSCSAGWSIWAVESPASQWACAVTHRFCAPAWVRVSRMSKTRSLPQSFSAVGFLPEPRRSGLMSTLYLSAEEVADLGMRLRGAGYGVGADQCI